MNVLILASVFPKAHPKSGLPTRFEEKFLNGKKIHTLRENKLERYRRGNKVSVRRWSDKPYRSEQVIIKDGVKIDVQPVRLFLTFDGSGTPKISTRVLGTDRMIDEFILSSNDGLSLPDFVDWFFPNWRKDKSEQVWNGAVIHFTDFRY